MRGSGQYLIGNGEIAKKIDASANADASVTITPDDDAHVLIDQIEASYDGTPTDGKLTITDGGTTVWEIDVTAARESIIFAGGLKCDQTTVVTLAAGGAGVTGKINVLYR